MNSKVPMVAGKPYGALTISAPDANGHIAIIQPHPSSPTSTVGYIVAKLSYGTMHDDTTRVLAPTPETVAYAKLFVAAPELAAALTRIVAWIDAGCDPSTKSLDAARAALAKAGDPS